MKSVREWSASSSARTRKASSCRTMKPMMIWATRLSEKNEKTATASITPTLMAPIAPLLPTWLAALGDRVAVERVAQAGQHERRIGGEEVRVGGEHVGEHDGQADAGHRPRHRGDDAGEEHVLAAGAGDRLDQVAVGEHRHEPDECAGEKREIEL